MELVKLVNGSTEARVVVNSTMSLIKAIGAAGLLPVYALCQGRRTDLPEDCKQQLERAGVLEPDGQIHSSVRNVVLSAMLGARWKGGNFVLGNPVTNG